MCTHHFSPGGGKEETALEVAGSRVLLFLIAGCWQIYRQIDEVAVLYAARNRGGTLHSVSRLSEVEEIVELNCDINIEKER